MHGLRALLLLVVIGVAFLSASEVQASASPPEPAPVPLPGLFVEGRAEIAALDVTVACTGNDTLDPSADCDVRATFVVRALDEVRMGAIAPDAAVILVEGRRLAEGEPIAAGTPVRVSISFRRSLAASTRDTEGPWLMMLVRARHIVLGEASTLQRVGDHASGLLVAGSDLHLATSANVDDSRAGEVVVATEGARLSLSLPPRPPSTSLIQHGGPVLSLGNRFDLFREDEGRFLLGVGYELGMDDYVSVALSIETDFDSVMESVMLDVGTPALLILFPGLVGGIGVVARQLGNRDPDAALRLRAGLQYPVVGLTADFDYWPSFGDWTASLAVRLSI